MTLTDVQVAQLLKPINPSRVAVLDGLSHLEAYDVRAHLIRLFGFGGWSGDVLSMELLYEEPTQTRQNKPAFKVAYRCTYRLTVNGLCSYTEVAVGESVMPDFKRGDCHDMAVKTAESQALKRCAVNLGDQFGLSLYRKGYTGALVRRTLVDHVSSGNPSDDVDHDAPPVEPEADSVSPPDSPPVESAQALPSGTTDSLPVVPEGSTEEEVAAQTAAQVEKIRDRVHAAMQEPSNQQALMKLTRIQLDAGKAGLMQQMTTTPVGEPVTVAVLLDTAVKMRSRG